MSRYVQPPGNCRYSGIEKLLATVRLVRGLREPALPDSGYPQRLAKAIADKIQKNNSRRRRILPPVAALVAGLLLLAVLTSWTGFFNRDVVYAMEKAVAQLSNYHGVLEMRSKNAAGEEWMIRRVELWSDKEKYAERQSDGTLIVNNGERKWQVRPQSKEVPCCRRRRTRTSMFSICGMRLNRPNDIHILLSARR